MKIVNVNARSEWVNPSKLRMEDEKLLYLICVKQILEEIFDIQLYQFETKEDYLDLMKWMEVYDKNNLSRDSLRSDIKEKLR
jgi:hypothetical protein